MSTSLNNIVNRAEQDALKEMIFRRAKERAEALNRDVQNNFTSSMQYEVMDLARATLSPERNPFANVIETKQASPEQETQAEKVEEHVGFPPRKNDEVRARVEENNRYYREFSTAKAIVDTMNDARGELTKKTTFMGALNFLNSQATISLVNSKGKNFNAIA